METHRHAAVSIRSFGNINNLAGIGNRANPLRRSLDGCKYLKTIWYVIRTAFSYGLRRALFRICYRFLAQSAALPDSSCSKFGGVVQAVTPAFERDRHVLLSAVEFRLSFGCDFTTRFFEENPLIAAILLAAGIIRRSLSG
jgi:hypothetical protein